MGKSSTLKSATRPNLFLGEYEKKWRTVYFGINKIKRFTLLVKQSSYSNVSVASTIEGHSPVTHSGSWSSSFFNAGQSLVELLME